MIKKQYIVVMGLIYMSLFSFGQQNLISNGSFEDVHGKRCDGWFNSCGSLFWQCDTNIFCSSGVIFENAPQIGGNWALVVTGEGNAPPGYTETYITNINETSDYYFSIWMKLLDLSQNGGVTIEKKSFGQNIFLKSIIADSSDWKYYEMPMDAVELKYQDTLFIRVYAMGIAASSSHIFVDLVQLIQAADTTPIHLRKKNEKKSNIIFFQDPVYQIITIEFFNATDSKINITVTSGMGEIFFQKNYWQLPVAKIIIDTKNWINGIYLLYINSSDVIFLEKFIKL